MEHLENINVTRQERLITPDQLKADLPVSDHVRAQIQASRSAIERILHGGDHRLLVVAGPCSIHDVDAAKDYARRLSNLAR